MVTTELGPFDREGTRIDVDVSSLGDAESLQGAMLLPTPLRGLDGQVYAVAQGGVSLGGWSAAGNQASISKNHQTVGRIPDGAIVERSELATFIEQAAGLRYLTLNLRNNDFTTAQRISDAINKVYPGDRRGARCRGDPGGGAAECHRRGHRRVHRRDHAEGSDRGYARDRRHQRAHRHDRRRRERRHLVRGHLAGQPGGQGEGDRPGLAADRRRSPMAATTEVIPDTSLDVEEQNAYLIPVERAVTVSELAKTLNAIGASPQGSDRDLQRPEEGRGSAGQADHHVGAADGWYRIDGNAGVPAFERRPGPDAVWRLGSRRQGSAAGREVRAPGNSAASASQRDEQEKQIGKDFESVLLTKLFEQVQTSIEDSGFDDEDSGSQQVRGMFWLYLARDVADKGGVGLWKDIYQQIKQWKASERLTGSVNEEL